MGFIPEADSHGYFGDTGSHARSRSTILTELFLIRKRILAIVTDTVQVSLISRTIGKLPLVLIFNNWQNC